MEPQKRKRSSPTPNSTNEDSQLNEQTTPDNLNQASSNNGLGSSNSNSSQANNDGNDDKAATTGPRSKRARNSSSTTKGASKSESSSKQGSNSKRRGKRSHGADGDDNDSALDPPDDANLREIQMPKTVPNTKHDLAPVRGGTVLDLDSEPTTVIDDEVDNNQAPEQTHYIVVPSYSSWFDYNSISVVERRALPEFFNNKNESKTPEVYLSHRNFIIDSYRLNPMEYLSVTACRRNLTGDVCAIMRVHAFLEQWGLINYQVEPDFRPTLSEHHRPTISMY